MITKTEFARIDDEVKQCLNKTFNDLLAKSPENYVLYLADAEYKKDYDYPGRRYSPYVIDNRMDYYKDESRMKFLAAFLTNYYTFPPSQSEVDNDEYRLHIELMIYTHIWEAKPFLKKLYRLAHLDDSEQYNWDVAIPDMSKHDFIRHDIRSTLEKNANPLSVVIKNGFHTSLRNAFAHSEYSFDTMNDNTRIWLDNYKGATWELQEVSFDEWGKRFVYSVLLSFYLFSISHERRRTIVQDLGTDIYTIRHPSADGRLNDIEIRYLPEQNGFGFL